MLIELQIIITSWAIVSLAGGGFGKVEEEEHQGGQEKNHPGHLQQADLTGTIFMDLVNRRKGSLNFAQETKYFHHTPISNLIKLNSVQLV